MTKSHKVNGKSSNILINFHPLKSILHDRLHLALESYIDSIKYY